MTADLTVAADRAGVVAAALGAHGRIDILVNNAGVQHVAPIEDFPPATVRAPSSRFTLIAPAMLIRAVIPGMYERGWAAS